MEAALAALGLVFVAELGDKTQLVALGLGAKHRTGPVLVGLALAYGFTNLLAAVVGGVLGATLPTRALGLGGGVLFLAFAAFSLREALDQDSTDEGSPGDDRALRTSNIQIIRTVAVMIFVAELGDKTQLATATLAAQASPVMVWIGATIGITASGAVGVGVGRAVGARLPERTVGIASSILFALFGLVLIAVNL